VIAERGDRSAPNFEVLTDGIISGDVGLHFVTQPFVQRPLPSDCCLSRSLGSTACFFEGASPAGSKPAHLCGAFALGQFAPGPLFEFGEVRSLFASVSLALGAYFLPGETHPTAAPTGTRQLTPLPFGYFSTPRGFARGRTALLLLTAGAGFNCK